MKNLLALIFIFTTQVSVAGVYSNTKKPKTFHIDKKRIISVKAVNNTFNKLEYSFSSSSIRPNYLPQIDQLAKTIMAGNYALALRGYADSIGNYTANWHLSEKRANVLKAYLIRKGVSENHIITTAFGSTKPVSTNKTALGRQRNRRVEIQLDKI